MAIKQGREYRALQDFSLVPRDEGSKEYRVRGTAKPEADSEPETAH